MGTAKKRVLGAINDDPSREMGPWGPATSRSRGVQFSRRSWIKCPPRTRSQINLTGSIRVFDEIRLASAIGNFSSGGIVWGGSGPTGVSCSLLSSWGAAYFTSLVISGSTGNLHLEYG